MRRCESSEKSSALMTSGGLGVGGVVEQDCAQDGLLRVHVRGQSGIEREVGDGGHTKEFRPNLRGKSLVNRQSGCVGIETC